MSRPLQTETVSLLARCASRPEVSRGRVVPEPESATRTMFQRDRDRIIHSAAFRRMKLKTQVFVYHEGDTYRTRLTHSLEVAQIARSICRFLGLNEDLGEAVALAHDLGHTPFGHAGEDALDAAMEGHGGFDHNEQTLRILTILERKYAEFDGLNLTWETLEGVVKHNGPLVGPGARDPNRPVPPSIADYTARDDLDLDGYPGLEAQIAALADDIAYNNHDIDDGLRAGLFSEADLEDVPLAGPVFAEVRSAYPDLERGRLIHEAVRRMIGLMVDDLIAETVRRVLEAGPRDVAEVRAAGRPLVAFSARMQAHDQALKAFLHRHMYRHFRVNRMSLKARRVVGDLFEVGFAHPECLPPDWRASAEDASGSRRARIVADYVAGMTDRYALDEHRRLFDPQARG